jgi:hypothetical protein
VIANRITGPYRVSKYLSEKVWIIKNRSELMEKSSSENVKKSWSIAIAEVWIGIGRKFRDTNSAKKSTSAISIRSLSNSNTTCGHIPGTQPRSGERIGPVDHEIEAIRPSVGVLIIRRGTDGRAKNKLLQFCSVFAQTLIEVAGIYQDSSPEVWE